MGFFRSEKKKDIEKIWSHGCYSCHLVSKKPNDMAVCIKCGIAWCWAHSGNAFVGKTFTLRSYCPRCHEPGYFYP